MRWTMAVQDQPPTAEQQIDGISLPVTASFEATADSAEPTPASCVGPVAQDRAGRVFGSYELIGEVAAGGMGIVYRARDRVLNRTVALKMLRYGDVAGDIHKQRFYREAQSAAHLNHPHIVPIFQIGDEGGQPYFTMALCLGGSLSEHREEYSELRRAVVLLEKVARAVDYAHTKGVLHRDLKPSNILLDERNEPQVSDFGIAKLAGVEQELTAPGALIGTPLYMSPEQATSDGPPLTPQSDIWALGVILYELVTGRRPFQARDNDQLWRQIRNDDPGPPSQLRPEIDRNLEAIVLKCLEKPASRRYPSAGALADDLAQWLAGEPVTARPLTGSRRAWRKVRRHRVAASLAVLTLSALIAGRLFAHFNNPDRPLHATTRQLDAGLPAVIVPATGLPAWSHWTAGANTASVSLASDKSLTLGSWSRALHELLPDPRSQQYRFSAEVRHNESDKGRVGLYFAHASSLGDSKRAHCLCWLAFSDLDELPQADPSDKGKNAVEMTVLRFDSTLEGHPLSTQKQHTTAELIFPAARFAPLPAGTQRVQPWRKLAVVVTSDSVTAYWEGRLIGVVSWNELIELADSNVRNAREPLVHEPAIGVRNALGLYIESGTASFRDVRVEPLIDNHK